MFATLVICRSIHYFAALALFGASAFTWALAPPSLAAMLDKSTWRLSVAATWALMGTAVGWLALEAGTMGERWLDAFDPGTLGSTLFSTHFGQAWQLHSVLVLCLSAGVAARRPVLVVVASALSLTSLGFVGHAAMQTGPLGWLHCANLAFHLAAAGIWIGGLVPLSSTLRILREPSLRTHGIIALRRFSMLGHGAVAIVIFTGIVNTVLILNVNAPEPPSPYEALLAAKIALIVGMIGLALMNRYWLAPRLRVQPNAMHALVRNCSAELALALAVVVLVSAFGLLEPNA